ncbi:hypothetical protein WMF45_07165 [Sorangium sp. So ce448]|uniref:hypothetical protein n=1 Tax=Sorangium sp. So ce448 TaxID=3133314 RepID=UPI003F61BB86
MPYVEYVFGNEEDFVAGLGFKVSGVDSSYSQLDTNGFRRMISEVVAMYPNLSVVATSLRTARTAGVNGWGGILYTKGEFYEVPGGARELSSMELPAATWNCQGPRCGRPGCAPSGSRPRRARLNEPP